MASSPKDTLSGALASLYARIPAGVKLGLGPMRAACARLGNPERSFATVHVAGTNGKGSVSAMVDAALRAAGMRVGLYTSPHLSRFAERIRIDGLPLPDADLLPLLGEVLTRAPELTFFETATLAAFHAFRSAGIDVAVVEVGLGGRLDATNVIPTPRAAAITRIAFDHMDRLGSTLVEIGREKAGIAKPGLDLVLGPLSPEVRAAIDEVAHAAGATTSPAADNREASRFLETATIGLEGAHQRDNARIAYILARRAGADAAATAHGVAHVVWPGRLETVKTASGDVLLDAAHNPDGVASLVAYLDARAGDGREVAVVFGALADKAWPEMLERISRTVARRFYVRPETHARSAVDPAVLAATSPGEPCGSFEDAMGRARSAVGDGGLVVVTGSIMLVGEARSTLLGLTRDPPVGM